MYFRVNLIFQLHVIQEKIRDKNSLTLRQVFWYNFLCVRVMNEISCLGSFTPAIWISITCYVTSEDPIASKQ
jgi:hypothetical protein